MKWIEWSGKVPSWLACRLGGPDLLESPTLVVILEKIGEKSCWKMDDKLKVLIILRISENLPKEQTNFLSS